MSEFSNAIQLTLDARERHPSGKSLRDAGVKAVDMATWRDDAAFVDRIILRFADGGLPFTSDDVQPYLPAGFRPAAVGSAFLRAANAKIIRDTKQTKRSERPEARRRKLTVWIGAWAA